MQKGGYNMYLMRGKNNMELYKKYKPKYVKYQDMEVQLYMAHSVSSDISNQMKSMIGCMSEMIVQGFVKGEISDGRK